jgi:hypothetical protein
MCKPACEIVETVQPGRIFTCEEGGLWFSGMNAHVGPLVHGVARALAAAGYTVGDPRDEAGGIYLPVEGVKAVSNEDLNRLVSPPGGNRGAVDEDRHLPEPYL